jgi:small subunit ribosomal protein S24e
MVMEIEIRSKEHQPLQRRTEVTARVAFNGATPTKKEAVAAVGKAMNAKPEMVIVRKMLTTYGDRSANVLAYVYDNQETLQTLESKSALKKHGLLKDAQKDEAKTGGGE